LKNIKAYLPVAQSFGFTTHLRTETSGRAFPQCVFDHWDILKDNPLTPGTEAYDVVLNIRKRKGLKHDVMPCADDYTDKL